MELKNCFTPNEVREALRTLPKTLTKTYDKIFDSLPKRSYIRAALQWIACSGRPLSLEELAVAAVIDPAVAKPNGSENQLAGGGKTIQEMLSKLIDVRKMERLSLQDFFDPKTKFDSLLDVAYAFERSIQYIDYPSHGVVFSHSSVRDYLLRRHDVDKSWSFSFSEDMANRFIAKSCLALIQNIPEGASLGNEAYRQGLQSLLMYVTRYWHTHAARLRAEEPGSLAHLLTKEPLAMRFLFLAKDELTRDDFGDIVGWDCFQATEPPSPEQKLQYAACSGFSCVLDTILASYPDLDVDAPTEHGSTALSLACQRKHWQIAKTLLEKGADPNKHDGMIVPLIDASEHGADEIVRELISHSADVNVEDEWDFEKTPLTAAIVADHPSTIKLLLINGADPNLMSSLGTTMSVAAKYGRHECMNLLLKHGASLEVDGIDSPSLLEYAAASGSVETIKLLLSQGLDVNEKICLMPLSEDAKLPANTYGFHYPKITISPPPPDYSTIYHSYGSPMHAAAANGYTEVVKLLVENNAAVNERSSYWETPATLAKLRGHQVTLDYLMSKGGVALEQTEVCYRRDLFVWSCYSNQGLRFYGDYDDDEDGGEDDDIQGDNVVRDDDDLTGCSGE